MTDRIGAEGLPTPSFHGGGSEAYLHRMCLLLDQISRRLDEMDGPVQEQDPVVELVTEPADPQPPKKATTRGRKKA